MKPMPSQKRIERELGLTNAQARAIRGVLIGRFKPDLFPAVDKWLRQCYNRPSTAELKMCAIDSIMGGFGVEAIWDRDNEFEPFAVYVNTGETYQATVVRYRTGTYRITSWGDIVESNRNIK